MLAKQLGRQLTTKIGVLDDQRLQKKRIHNFKRDGTANIHICDLSAAAT
jgi:hypothetical protein